MGILDEAWALEAERPAHLVRCPIAKILAEMGDEDRDELIAALDDPAIKSKTIAAVLNARGYRIGAEGVARHRRPRGEGCRCEK